MVFSGLVVVGCVNFASDVVDKLWSVTGETSSNSVEFLFPRQSLLLLFE